MTQHAQNLYDAACGCLFGACIGDAAGAVLEMRGLPSAADVAWALQMPGGGVWQVAPGQITDDGELTLCLAQALAQSADFQLETIAQNYAAWIESNPFDIGITTSRSLGCISAANWQTTYNTTSYAVAMTQAAAAFTSASKANGSLMLATQLGIWGYQFYDAQLAQYARADSQLSHANPTCGDAVACYVIAIASLLRHPGDRTTAFQRVQAWAELDANDEVRDWLDAAARHVNEPYYPQSGFVKIAFIHAFRHLHSGTDYVAALRETLAGGGDTDTNACIVGGLIGAACGAAAIPTDLKQPVLTCNTSQSAHPRPEFLHTTHLETLTKQLLKL